MGRGPAVEPNQSKDVRNNEKGTDKVYILMPSRQGQLIIYIFFGTGYFPNLSKEGNMEGEFSSKGIRAKHIILST